MKMRIIQVGKSRDVDLSVYLKRIKPFANLEVIEVKEVTPSTTFSKEKCLEKEGENILRVLGDGFIVALDERGKEMTSMEFSKFLGKFKDEGQTIIFVIGGAYGLDDAVKKRADFLMSFSKMTFTHQMIRLFLLEQIYRGLCILMGKEYHND